MYMPWAYDTQHEGVDNREAMMNILRDLDKTHCTCPFGAAGKEVGYPCPGTCLDWAYGKLGTPYVFAFEIYKNPPDDPGLKLRWDHQIATGGGALLESGANLGHSHFHAFFA